MSSQVVSTSIHAIDAPVALVTRNDLAPILHDKGVFRDINTGFQTKATRASPEDSRSIVPVAVFERLHAVEGHIGACPAGRTKFWRAEVQHQSSKTNIGSVVARRRMQGRTC